jgi:hypothetical protein
MSRIGHLTRIVILIGVCVGLAAGAWAGENRTLEHRTPAAGIEHLALDAGVGDVTISAGPGDEIVARVTLKPRRGGIPFFSSNREGRRQVEEASLKAQRDGTTLELSVPAPNKEHQKFEERWEITVPARLAVDLDAGVGNVKITGLSGGINIDAGVGDIDVQSIGGDIRIDGGVGDIDVTTPANTVGRVDVSAGVGECEIHTDERTIKGKSLGCDAAWTGQGSATLKIEAGVGEVTVKLT